MNWHCGMVGCLWESSPSIPVANPSQLNMLLPVLSEDFQFDTCTATLLAEVYSIVRVEPHLRPLSTAKKGCTKSETMKWNLLILQSLLLIFRVVK